LLEHEDLAGKKLLDLGAGPGYLSWKLDEFLAARGIDGRDAITACDLYPEQFKYDRLTCRFGDFSDRLQFADDTFDIVICMEVIEHVADQKQLVAEIARILKPGGRVLITTPNTLNINSRLQYLFTGTMPLFDIMPVSDVNVVHTSGHINPISAYYMFFFAKLAGFETVRFHIDRFKKSGVFWGALFWPVIALCVGLSNALKRSRHAAWSENREAFAAVNGFKLLSGRTTIMDAVLASP
jgi:2-polyprenyl-3-methyl-5-hydroxy-6-metoxy-1,4-benzoquinol methylase